jgi:hypothetical protein
MLREVNAVDFWKPGTFHLHIINPGVKFSWRWFRRGASPPAGEKDAFSVDCVGFDRAKGTF